MFRGGIFLSTLFNEVLSLAAEKRRPFVQERPELFVQMFERIGHPEGKVRDQQNYRLFIELLSADQIPHDIVKQWASQLPAQLVDFESTVFGRSFSALWLAGIVHADRQLQLLSSAQYETIVQAATKLLSQEHDLRSFIDEKSGWAHSVAHAVDLLVACVEHPMFTLPAGPPMLQAMKHAFWKETVFVDDEEERFVRLVAALIGRSLEEEVLVEWLEQLFDRVEQVAYTQGYTPSWFKGRTNTMHFTKTLYFKLKFSHQYDRLRGVSSIFIQKWSQ